MRHGNDGQPMKVWIAVTGLALILCARPATAGQYVATGSASPTPRRNVLLFIADDVGVDQIERYVNNYTATHRTDDDLLTSTGATVVPPGTPNITALASAGVTFVNTWSSPVCSATRAGIYTGLYGAHNGITGVVSTTAVGLDPTKASTVTIAQVLKARTYANGLFGKWHLGSYDPTSLGWDLFEGSLGGELEDYTAWTKSVRPCSSGAACDAMTPDIDASYATFVNVDDAYNWITTRPASSPWMATVAFNAPHWVSTGPDEDPNAAGIQSLYYQNPPNDASRWCSTSGSADTDVIFGEIIECMDAQIGYLLEELKSHDASVLNQTTIIFMGDNGTDNDRTQAVAFSASDRGKGTVYESGVAVPLIIADGSVYSHNGTGSGVGRVVHPGMLWTAQTQTVDLFNTIAEIAGSSTRTADSYSLIPVLESTGDSGRNYSFTQDKPGNLAAREKDYKLIYIAPKAATKTTAAQPASCELYNLLTDRWEQDDLLSVSPTASELSMRNTLVGQIKTKEGLTASCP